MSKPDELVTIASLNNVQADVLRMHLEARGIPVFLQGEVIGTYAPYAAGAGGASAVRVQVPAARAQEACAFLAEWDSAQSAVPE